MSFHLGAAAGRAAAIALQARAVAHERELTALRARITAVTLGECNARLLGLDLTFRRLC